MKIQSAVPLSFSAKLINTPNVQIFDKNGSSKSQKVSFMEYVPSRAEANALDDAVRLWYEDKFGGDIAYDAMLIADGREDSQKHKVYILSSQTDNFEKVEPDKILGLAHVEKLGKNTVRINHLQTNSNLIQTPYGFNKDIKYKGIGRAIVKTIQQLNSNCSIILESIYSAVNFYEKLGFEMISPKYFIMKWKKSRV